MRKGLIKNNIPYKPITHSARFWITAENCYTEDELNFRQMVIKTRANSGIHPDYLANPSSWFAEDAQALININDKSWFFPHSFKPRQSLSRDEFHVQPLDSQRLQWPALFDLMQITGDYLLLRNKDLPLEHLNQPLNYVLLDLINMLKGLSQNNDINQVRVQLELMNKYIRSLEKNLSPRQGSDRIFLADFRATIDDEIEPMLIEKIEAQLLRERLQELGKTISQLSTERNRILHFALNISPVNPHPYHFSIDRPHELMAYPTQAAKKCAQGNTELANPATHLLHLSAEQLSDCPNFKLISMNDEVLGHYASAISDLNELDRFQKVVGEIIDLLAKAGEVYTIFQFKEQMLHLLKEIDQFVDHSSVPIESIIQANTLAYHQAIHDQQVLSLWINWASWLSADIEKLKNYIKNQDNLAQFPSTSADLARTNKALKEQTSHVITHLSQPKEKQSNFAALSGQAQELNRLMNSMHHWISLQHERKGIAPPQEPQQLHLLTDEPHCEVQNLVPLEQADRVNLFFNNQKAIANQKRQIELRFSENPVLAFGFVAMLPVALIIWYFFIKKPDTAKSDEPRHGMKT